MNPETLVLASFIILLAAIALLAYGNVNSYMVIRNLRQQDEDRLYTITKRAARRAVEEFDQDIPEEGFNKSNNKELPVVVTTEKKKKG